MKLFERIKNFIKSIIQKKKKEKALKKKLEEIKKDF